MKHYMRQAIIVKFLPCTNHKPSRWSARASAGRIVRSSKYELSSDANARAVAKELAEKFNWTGNWYGGQLYDGSYVFTCTDKFDKSPDFKTVDATTNKVRNELEALYGSVKA